MIDTCISYTVTEQNDLDADDSQLIVIYAFFWNPVSI